MFIIEYLVPIFLFVWSLVFPIFYISMNGLKNKYDERIETARTYRVQRYQCESKEIWEKSFKMKADAALSVSKIYSPIYIFFTILGLFINQHFPYFAIIEVIVLILGLVCLGKKWVKVAENFGASTKDKKTVTFFTKDIFMHEKEANI